VFCGVRHAVVYTKSPCCHLHDEARTGEQWQSLLVSHFHSKHDRDRYEVSNSIISHEAVGARAIN